MAVFSMVMSFALIKMAYNHNYGFINSVVLVFSFFFTVVTAFYKFSGYDVNGSVDVYTTAIKQGAQTNINDCDQLQGNDYGRFEKVKESLRNNCGGQDLNDIHHITTGMISTMYSALYNEFSLASVFIDAPTRKNKCLGLIDEFLTMCPERKIYFSQENLQMLRDFERKQ
ncbi:hypothetical protein GTD56_004518 [Salmonella enterica subsp. diarizonae]|nr:hypothetical protein [Salmonella enterica subsp. diarizonae]EIO3282837.1 hypothetical protein [Salmonella enterica]